MIKFAVKKANFYFSSNSDGTKKVLIFYQGTKTIKVLFLMRILIFSYFIKTTRIISREIEDEFFKCPKFLILEEEPESKEVEVAYENISFEF